MQTKKKKAAKRVVEKLRGRRRRSFTESRSRIVEKRLFLRWFERGLERAMIENREQ